MVTEALGPRLAIVWRTACYLVPVLTILMLSWEWDGISGQPLRDTAAYYMGARAADDGGSIYEPLPPPGPHEFRGRYHYIYPPPLAALLSLLPDVSYRTFDRGWLILNLAAFWVFAAALGRIASGRWSGASVLTWAALLFYLPGTWSGIHFGNIQLVVQALVTVGLAVPASAGFALALAAAVKVTPGWPLLARTWREPRATLPGAAAAAVACLALCLAVFGMSGTVEQVAQWLRDVLPTLSQGQFWGESITVLRAGDLRPIDYFGNLSLSFLPVQLAVLNGWSYSGGELPAAVRGWLTMAALLGPVVAAWLTRQRGSTLQVAVVFAAAVLAAPIVRPYQAMPALLLVLAAFRGERRERAGSVSNDVGSRQQHSDGVLVHHPPPG